MTTKTIKTILFASVIAALIIPVSGMMMADASPNEHASEKAVGPIGKVSDGTFSEANAQERLSQLFIEQMESDVSHADEIEEIETEYQKLYVMDSEVRADYEILSDKISQKMEDIHADKSRSIADRLSEFPIISVGVDSKTKSIQIALDSDYVSESELNQWKGKIHKMLKSDNAKITLRLSEGISANSHTSSRVTWEYDPLYGGASIGFEDGQNLLGCGVGYIATENGSGDEGFVSAGHCTKLTGYGQTGEDVYQPVDTANSDERVVGVVDEEDFTSSTYCDCSFTEFGEGESGLPRVIYNSNSYYPVYSQYTISSSSEGLTVIMSGPESGVETGTIDTWKVSSIYIEGIDATLKNTFKSTYDAVNGDSGSSVLRLNGIAGIHVASEDDGSYTYGVTVSRTNSYLGVSPVLDD